MNDIRELECELETAAHASCRTSLGKATLRRGSFAHHQGVWPLDWFPSGGVLSSSRLEGGSVDVTVATRAERDQLFVCFVPQPASAADGVNLGTIGTAAVLASSAVTFQPFGAEFTIRIWVQPKSRSPRS